MPELRITGAAVGPATRYDDSGGDVWAATWADDGHVYLAADDCSGFGGACDANLAVHRLVGDEPPDLRGEVVNCMADYGAGAALLEDGASWKANGITCVDGVLYMSVSRHRYMDVPPPAGSSPIQQTWDASIVASKDHGETWTSVPTLGAPMFRGRAFSTLAFVEHGQDGAGGFDEHIYAASNDGSWNNGSGMILGRVRRDRLPRLEGGDWEFYRGLDGDGGPLWGRDSSQAVFVLWAPGRMSMAGIHHIAALDRYVLTQWHYPRAAERDFSLAVWELYEARRPWGPWSRFHRHEHPSTGFYNYSLPAKYMSSDGRSLWALTAGDFTYKGPVEDPFPFYRLHFVPIELDVDAGTAEER